MLIQDLESNIHQDFKICVMITGKLIVKVTQLYNIASKPFCHLYS